MDPIVADTTRHYIQLTPMPTFNFEVALLNMLLLLLTSAMQGVALDLLFEMHFFKVYLGWGLDGKGSKWFSGAETRDVISALIAIPVCLYIPLQFPCPDAFGAPPTYERMMVTTIFAIMIQGGGMKFTSKVFKRTADSAKDAAREAREAQAAIRNDEK